MDWSFGKWGGIGNSYPNCSIPSTFGAQVGPWTKRGEEWERRLAGTVVAECYAGSFQFAWKAAGLSGYGRTPEDAMAAADSALAESQVTRG